MKPKQKTNAVRHGTCLCCGLPLPKGDLLCKDCAYWMTATEQPMRTRPPMHTDNSTKE